MKTTSWEIILAGFLFVGVAIYLVENYSENNTKTESTALSIDLEKNIDIEQLGKLELKQLRELENLEQLSELEDLQKLEHLKSLSSFLPAEIQAEFESEINEVMKDLEQENIVVALNKSSQENKISLAQKENSGTWTVVSPGIYSFYQEIDANTFKEADLELPFGTINIVGTTNGTASLSLQASGQIKNKADLQSKIRTVSVIENGKGVFSISPSEAPSSNQNIQLHATLSIPKNSRLKAYTRAGHINSEDIDGIQNYQTLGGHIKLNNIGGQVQAKTNGGHVSLSQGNGEFFLQSLGGHIQVNETEGKIIMKTSGGNLQASDIKGSIQGATNGGNIELRFLSLQGSSTAQTGAGTISIWVPQLANSTFNLSGNNVEIAEQFDFKGSKTTGFAKGVIGTKNASVEAKTNYGNIILKVQD